MKYHHFISFSKSVKLLEEILQGSTQCAVVAIDTDNRVLAWNVGAEHILGQSAEDMLGSIFSLYFYVHQKEETITSLIKNASSTADTEAMIKTANGMDLPVHVTITPMTESEGTVYGYLIIFKALMAEKLQEKLNTIIIDISRLMNSNHALDDILSEVLGQISECLAVPALYLCLHDHLTKSLTLTSQRGLRQDELPMCSPVRCYPKTNQPCGCFCSNLCHKTYKEQLLYAETFPEDTINSTNHFTGHFTEEMCFMHIPIKSDQSLHGILHLLIPNRMEFLLCQANKSLSLIADQIGAGLKRKQLEEELQRYANDLEKIIKSRTDQLREKDAQLAQSGKLATLGEMATGIAHEINQPLGAISLIAQGLQRAKQLGRLTDGILESKLESIHNQIERINKIIRHLRNFGRNSSIKKEYIDINDPLNDVFVLIGLQLENHAIAVSMAQEPGLMVMADHNRLEQVFLNIIGNARDALDEQDETVMQFKKIEKPPEWVLQWEKKISIRSYREGNKIIVDIEDTGGGIPKHVFDRIFDPFFTTKEVGKGTGLGLYISYGIIREFGGEIIVTTKTGAGSVFKIILPSATPT